MTKWKKYRIRKEPSWNPWQRPNVEVTHFFNKKHSRNEFENVTRLFLAGFFIKIYFVYFFILFWTTVKIAGGYECLWESSWVSSRDGGQYAARISLGEHQVGFNIWDSVCPVETYIFYSGPWIYLLQSLLGTGIYCFVLLFAFPLLIRVTCDQII